MNKMIYFKSSSAKCFHFSVAFSQILPNINIFTGNYEKRLPTLTFDLKPTMTLMINADLLTEIEITGMKNKKHIHVKPIHII